MAEPYPLGFPVARPVVWRLEDLTWITTLRMNNRLMQPYLALGAYPQWMRSEHLTDYSGPSVKAQTA